MVFRAVVDESANARRESGKRCTIARHARHNRSWQDFGRRDTASVDDPSFKRTWPCTTHKSRSDSHWAHGPAAWKEVSLLWARASETTLGRAARCPMVLLDFNFQRVAWWSRVIDGPAVRRISAIETDRLSHGGGDTARARSSAGGVECGSFHVAGLEPCLWYGARGHDADSPTLAARYRSSGRPQSPGHEASLGKSAHVLEGIVPRGDTNG